MKLNWTEIRNSFFRSLIPVGLTYSAALIGIEYFSAEGFEFSSGDQVGALGLLLVPLFTLTHCVVPVFFYFVFVSAIYSMKKRTSAIGWSSATLVPFLMFTGFVYLHLGFWYGIPTLILAFSTEWLTIPVAIIHILLAKKGTRTWVFLEYGSTSFSLLLFLFMFSGEAFFPYGVLVMLFQILLLTIVDWKGRDLWLNLGKEKSGQEAF
ncbi:MAG: hypothetical protein MK108_00380 [Mariniblastus sp.]|nr:hypothetical protein [Mariniblastus sp.]